MVGLYSIYFNGVSHSMAFSAIMATTRNPDLDLLTQGASLGAEPLEKRIDKIKLKFGPLVESSRDEVKSKTGKTKGTPHIAFGFEDTVGILERGASYT
jgi:hypothetical protein